MFALFSKIHSLLSVKSTTLIYIVTAYFSFPLNIRFWQFIFDTVNINSFKTAWFVFSLIFFIMIPIFIMLNILAIKRLSKILISLFLIFSASSQYLLLHYGIYIDKNMMENVFETTPREAFDLLTLPLILWTIALGIIPSLLLLFTKIKYRPFKQELRQRIINCILAFLVLVFFAGISYKEYATFGRNNRSIKGIINTVNYTAGTIRYIQKIQLANKTFKTIDENAKLAPYEDDLYTVFILIVGETARASNFSINGYNKETNPLLSKQHIINFNNVSSCGTATAISVPCIFSSKSRADFDTGDAKYTENLLDLLQKSGYEVIWKDNDDGCKGVCDRITQKEEMVKTGNSKYCNNEYCYDEVLLEDLPNILQNIKKDTVIVLHTMGSHGPTYYNRYPDKFKKFMPTCDTADIQNCSTEEIINTYDNTILYTDYVISSAIDIMKNYPQYESGLLYVSDHGESLGENNIYLHGMPYKIAPKEQKNVPMIMWMSDNMQKYDHLDYECINSKAQNNSFNHDNLFHSLLGLLEVKTKVYEKDLDLFETCRLKPLP